MATLVSPGVDVSIVNETQTTSNDTRSTIPLIVLATHQDKATPDGTGVAAFTTKDEAGELKLITNSRELVQQYGNPVYYDSNGTTLQGSELNELGLLSAYKALNVTNRCYVIRADVDLNELASDATAPTSDPVNGTYWFDYVSSLYGLFEYEEGVWVNKVPTVLSSDTEVTGGVPTASYGKDGDYAAVVRNDANTDGVVSYFQKIAGSWLKLGSSAWDTATPSIARSTIPFSSLSSATLAGLPTTGDTLIVDVNGAGAQTVTLANTVEGTTTLAASNTLGLKTLILNSTTVTLGNSAGGSIANATYVSNTAAVSGLQVGDVMRITDTAGSDDITMAITVTGSGFSGVNTDLGGTLVINGANIALSGEATAAALATTIGNVIGSGGTNDQGFTVSDSAGEVVLLKNRAVSGENNADSVVIDVSGVTGVDTTGLSTGTTAMSIAQVASSITAGVTNTNNVTATVTGAGPYTLTISDSATGIQLSNSVGTPVTDLGLARASSVALSAVETEIEAAVANMEVDDTAGNDVPTAGESIRLVFSGTGDFVVGAGTANTELGLTANTYKVSINSIVDQINAQLSFLNTTAATDTNGSASYITITNTDSFTIDISGTANTTLGFPSSVSTSSLYFASHTSVPSSPEEGDIWIKTTTPNLGANYSVKVWDASLNQWLVSDAPMYASNIAAFDGYGANLVEGSLYVRYNDLGTGQADFRVRRYNGSATLIVTEANFTDTVGSNIRIGNGRVATAAVATDNAATFVSAVNGLGQANLEAEITVDGVVIRNIAGEDIVLENGTANVDIVLPSLAAGVYSNWIPLRTVGYTVSATAPTAAPAEGRLWFDGTVSLSDIDLLVNDDATNQWVNFTGDIQISATRPNARNNGSSALVAGDLWIDSSDFDNYPVIKRWDTSTGGKWVTVDKSDSTTPSGIVFADARPTATDNLDPDAPNPLLYPAGILLWNTRASSMVVKEYRADWFKDDSASGENFEDTDFTTTSYTVGNDTFAAVSSSARWVTVSGSEQDGTPYMGRKAQRAVIVQAMAAALASNDDIRDYRRNFFNLMLAPGYPELMDEMVSLNIDRKETAFIIGDTPKRLSNSSTSIQDWATNANNAASNGEDGLTTKYRFAADYYPPLGLTTNVDGSEVVAPASLGALYSYLYNDNVAYPWFAPAGINRGLLSGVFSSVGYLTRNEEEFNPVQLSKGLEDALYTNKINPIVFSPSRGFYVNGQRTLSPSVDALDRVNVARLIVYLRYQLELLAEEFLFEQNDEITRNVAQTTFTRFMSGLLGLRAINDYVVVCDETNNTPDRISRNEMWIDIAIQPTQSVEFIYIPVRATLSELE